MILTLSLLLSTLVVAALLFSAWLPAKAALWLGAALNTVQLHSVSILGIYPSLALLSWLALWRTAFSSALWRWRWMQALLALAVVQAISLLWAPTPMAGVRYLIYLLPLPLAALGFYGVTREQPQWAQRCLRLLLAGTAFEAVLVVLFRALPSLEDAFLHFPLAQLFVSPNTLAALFDTGGNNVLDAAKAGGVFVNANIAATYLGMSAVMAWYVGQFQNSNLLRAVAVLDWVAVGFAGSKAGLICAVAVPSMLAFFTMMRGRRINPLSWVIGSAIAAAAILALLLPFGRQWIEDYRHDSVATLGTRQQIWQFAIQMLSQHPLTGLGFGGWEQRFEVPAQMQGLVATLPPHNSFFILWLQSGAFGLLAGIVLIVALLAAVRRVLRAGSAANRPLAMALGGALAWYLIQGLGENFGLMGEIHMTPLLGALLGFLCAQHDVAMVQHDSLTTPAHRAAASPAVLAV